MSRRTSIGLALIAVLLAIYAAAYVFELNKVKNTHMRSIAAHVVQFDRQIEQLSFIPKLLSGDTNIVNAIRLTTPEHVQLANLRLQKAQIDSGLDFAFLMNMEGITVASSNWGNAVSFVGKDYSFRPYFKNAARGMSSTYFAVGATTGVPGYFIAEPVSVNSIVMGVVVAKMALSAPVETWRGLDFETAILDEYGVAILASSNELLYRATRPLLASEIDELNNERRYPTDMLENSSISKTSEKYRKYSAHLQSEPWQYITLVAKHTYHLRAAYISAISFAFACIALLLFRTYRQQRHMVASEQRHSRELEGQVKRRTAELEKAQDALIAESNYAILGKMSAAINHEINQPLASLRLNLASLRKLVENPSGNVKDIEEIVVESDRTTKRIGLVIASLRNYTRKNRMRVESINVMNLIEEVASSIRIERPTMSKHLTLSGSLNKILIDGDRVLLQQALFNLLYNAIDSVIQNEHPIITLSLIDPMPGPEILKSYDQEYTLERIKNTDPSKCYVGISVKDNGDGVPLEILPSLFEPFSTNKDHQGGLGLGLTIANQIAESHKGMLIYSRVTNGSRFTLLLPTVKN
ncbi:MAG: ATP-binding protein [Granulosicoccus sp.]